MSKPSKIVAGGGWTGVRVVRIKVRAWLALLLAVGCGALSLASAGTLWSYAWVPAMLCLIVSVVLFFREPPREASWFGGRVGTDRGKLYGRRPMMGYEIGGEAHRISAPTRQTSSSKASSPQN